MVFDTDRCMFMNKNQIGFEGHLSNKSEIAMHLNCQINTNEELTYKELHTDTMNTMGRR